MAIFETLPDGQRVIAKCLPNDEGFLAKIVIEEILALDFSDAERKTYAIANGALTHLGVLCDVPLHIFHSEVEEAWSGKTKVGFIAPFAGTPPLIKINAKGPSKELQACASFYREGLVSTSVLYQYLCYFKGTESVRVVRKRAARRAARMGEPFSRPEEQFPDAADTTWLDCLYYEPPKWDALAVGAIFIKPVLGRPFENLLTTELGALRNEVAHAIADSASDLTSADDMELHYRAIFWLPPLRMMARRMLKSEFPSEFLLGVPDKNP